MSGHSSKLLKELEWAGRRPFEVCNKGLRGEALQDIQARPVDQVGITFCYMDTFESGQLHGAAVPGDCGSRGLGNLVSIA